MFCLTNSPKSNEILFISVKKWKNKKNSKLFGIAPYYFQSHLGMKQFVSVHVKKIQETYKKSVWNPSQAEFLHVKMTYIVSQQQSHIIN